MVGLLEACRAGTATEADFVAADFDYLKADSVDLVRESRDGLDRVRKIVADLKDFSRLDSGKGMRPEVLARIFDPFYTTKPVGKGTRLGLSISYDIVIKHRGRIDVRSEPGCGSTFRVSLPRVAPGLSVAGTKKPLALPAGAVWRIAAQ